MEEWNWINKYTGTEYDKRGVNIDGYDEDGYDRKGYNKQGYDRNGYNRIGFHKQGYDEDGYDKRGFDRDGINKYTGDEYDWFGKDKYGYNMAGYNEKGYDKEGYDKKGYNKQGYDRKGYNRRGYDRKGYNKDGFDIHGVHKDTKTEYNLDGYDKDGFNEEGYNKDGKDKTGKTKEQRKEIEQMQRRNWLGLIAKAKKLANGEMSIEEYIMQSKTSLDDLINLIKKENLPNVVRMLYKHRKAYNTYTKPFKKKEYLESISILVNGEEVKPTEQDIDGCIEYLKANSILICDHTVRSTISKYKKGEIDITQRVELSLEERTKTELETLEDEQTILKETLKRIEEFEDKIVQADDRKQSTR